MGKVHTITQGEGGEQGDAMIPLLFSLGQHSALARVQSAPHEDGIFVRVPGCCAHSHHARARQGRAPSLGREVVG